MEFAAHFASGSFAVSFCGANCLGHIDQHVQFDTSKQRGAIGTTFSVKGPARRAVPGLGPSPDLAAESFSV
jgi:hypothetical protein